MLPARQTILIVEDEPSIADTVIYALGTEGFATIWRATAREAVAVLAEQPIDLVILDVGLPDSSGFDLCREIRRRGSVPIIFLTARSAEVDRVVGLEIGADDYLAKPFSPRELTARVRAILRRVHGGNGGSGSATSPGAKWAHDVERCRISYRGIALDLTRNEYRLLGVLLKSPGRVFSREQLMAAAWEEPGAALDRTVDAHVKMLRAKLRAVNNAGEAGDDDPIVTHRGLGYSLKEA